MNPKKKLKDSHLSTLIEILRVQGFKINYELFEEGWTEVYLKTDIARFVLGTKAETLSRLRNNNLKA